MGLFSSLFGGGGGNNVQQQASNNTTVEVGVDIQNIMDMTGIQKVLEWLGLKQVEFQEKQLEQNAQGTVTAQQLLESMKEENAQRQKVLDSVLPWVNRLGLAIVAAIGFWIWRKWK